MQNQLWGLLIAIDVKYLKQNAKDNHRKMTRLSSVIWLQTMDKLEKWTSHVMTENLKLCCFEVFSSLLVTIKKCSYLWWEYKNLVLLRSIGCMMLYFWNCETRDSTVLCSWIIRIQIKTFMLCTVVSS